ncbi:hypothetical protein ACQPZZ_21945 [Microbispora sp. CA-135349]|uniref:hypothetical protein n=1 Tax=Microbispora sp. CA-135349 TaxID=3239953 RepID=UPI003D8EEBDE
MQKNDGNSTYNYWGLRLWGTCTSEASDMGLDYCEVGSVPRPGAPVQAKWLDWHPRSSKDTTDCSTIGIELEFLGITAPFSHTECGKATIYKGGTTVPGPGTFRSRWTKGVYLIGDTAKTTSSAISVTSPQGETPKWDVSFPWRWAYCGGTCWG